MSEIVNKVASSGLMEIDPAEFVLEGKRLHIDIAAWLFEGLILKEKDFREKIKAHDWKQYENSFVSVDCSTDAIIPSWAWMLLTVALAPYAKRVIKGNRQMLETVLVTEEIRKKLKPDNYAQSRVVVKGCGNVPIPDAAYAEISLLLSPVVKSLMFGEPCSTVPVFKATSLNR